MGTTITGPVTGGTHGWPFGATLADLAGHGYVEEEFFFEGEAKRYRPTGPLGVDGRWAAEADGTGRFKTRAVVLRPVDPERFNGTVLVEWNNVSAGSDIFEVGDTPVVFDEGFAYVGVSAQRAGVHGFAADPHGLRAWDPERYGSLDVPDDGLSYGIFSEVARAVAPDREVTGVDPLGGLVVERILAVGGSQSAGRLVSYINAVQPIEQVFEGFVPFTWFGSGTSIDDPAVVDLSSGLGALQMLPTRVRDDLDVPVIVVNSECETLSCVGVRQPDTDRFRFWEVAGAPHGPRLHMERIVPKQERDGLGAPGGTFDASALSPVPWAPVLDAAVARLDRWVRDGTPPPSQPLIEVDADGGQPRIRRDDDGNALGGVRVPEMEAPLARHTAAREEAGAGGLMGRWEPFPVDVVRARYADRAAYLAAYETAARAAVAAGVMRPGDADAGIERSKAETLP